MAFPVSRLLSALLLVGSISPAWCQGSASSPGQGISQSSGLQAAIGSINAVKEGAAETLAVQLILKNITKDRLYLFMTGDHEAALSDGKVLLLKDVVGLTYCRMLYPQEQATEYCIDQHGGDLNYYSYIDPAGEVDLSLRYSFKGAVPREYAPSGTLSFRIIAVARVAFAPSSILTAQDDQRAPSTPQLIILNFPLTLLSH